VSVHVERVNGEIVSGQIERLEDFGEGEILAISVNDDFLKVSLSSGVKHYPNRN
jgi:hypothetical protein